MSWWCWVILSLIIAANIGTILLALYVGHIRSIGAPERQVSIDLSGYTLEQLIEECNRDFNDPSIIWPSSLPNLNFQTMQQNFDFIMRCIMSCNNEWQLKIVYNMIERFHALYADAKDLYDQLMEVILTKQSMIN
jgi:hypothetical protein